jgi:hypothetical protein
MINQNYMNKNMNQKITRSLLLAIISSLVFIQSCNNPQTEGSKIENSSQTANKTEIAANNPEAVTEAPTATPTPETKPNPLAKFDLEKSAKLTDTAKLIAGMKIEDASSLAAIQNTTAWKNHAEYFQNGWPQLENQQLAKVRKWTEAELKTINESSPKIFYPFSGPDFLYAYSFFPKAKEYVMIGLEPVGTVPDLQNMSDAQIAQQLQIIHQSLYAILEYSFFRTKAMAVDLAKQGVLPVLLLFLARTDNQILDVQYVGLDAEAKIQIVEPGATPAGMIPGVKISFLPAGESEPKTLHYFSTDLSNDGLKKTPQLVEFAQTYAKDSVTYLKAASYLMYNEYFSTIRDLILTQSYAVLQDDSGMPVKHFDEAKWERKFYGQYIAPIDLFASRYQPDLRKIYQSDKTIQPLDFGIGYKFYKDSNLMLAIRKAAP